MADCERLTRSTEQHLLVSDKPGESDGVHGNARDVGPEGTGQQLGRLDGTTLWRNVGDPFGGRYRCSRRCIDLAVVVQFDDLACREVRCSNLSETHHHDGPYREVRHNEAIRWTAPPLLAQLGDAISVES